MRERILSLGADLPRQSEIALAEGRPMLAEALLIYASEQFPESEVSDSAELSLRVLKKKPIFRTAQKHWGLLKKVVRESQRGDERSEPSRLQALLDSIPASERCLETLEAIDVLERALYAKGPSALAEAWNSIEVRVEP